jgi:biotin carboxylase/trans-aconitate methyltransferase
MVVKRHPFDDLAGDYDRFRPRYPRTLLEGVAARVPRRPGLHVVDAGAGTGIALEGLRPLLAPDARCEAVDVSADMVAVGRAKLPEVEWAVGEAEPFLEARDGVDLVVAAQAYQWMDRPRFLAAARACLRPGGVLAILQNNRDHRASPFLHAYEDLLEDLSPGYSRRYRDFDVEAELLEAFPAPGAVVEAHRTRWEQVMPAEAFLGMSRSSTQAQRALAAHGERFLRRLAALVDDHADADGRVVVPYRSEGFTAVTAATPAQRGPHVLVVGNGREIPSVLHDVRPDVRTTVLVRTTKARRVRDPRRHVRILGLPHDDGREWLEAARAIHARDPFDRIGSFSDVDQDHAAAIGADLGLPTHAVDTVRWVRDKVAMRERLAQAGVEQVAAQRVAAPEDVAAFAGRHGYPVVVKPVAGAASSGVSIVRGPDDLAEAWAWGRAAREPDDDALMVEPCLPGPELSVEAFSHGGEHHVVALTDKVKEPRHFVELGHMVRGAFAPDVAQAVGEHVRRALDALGVRDGITHTELILAPAGPTLVETHLRRGGDGILDALREAYGLDLVELLVRQTVGEDVRPALRAGLERMAASDAYPAIWYAVPPAAGRIVAVDGVPEAQAAEGVTAVEVELGVGDDLPREILDSRSRALAVRALGPSPREALERAQRAARLVRYTVVADPA